MEGLRPSGRSVSISLALCVCKTVFEAAKTVFDAASEAALVVYLIFSLFFGR